MMNKARERSKEREKMSTMKELEAEIKAIEGLLQILEPLEKEAQKRVLEIYWINWGKS